MAVQNGNGNANGEDDQENDEDDVNTVQYQFKVDRDLWEDWKETVPRSQKLDERIITLVEHDLEDKRDD